MERCGCLATAYIPSGKRPYKRYFWMRSWFSAIAAPPAMGTISWIPETWMEIVRTCWIFCRGFPESWREMGIASGLLLGFLPQMRFFAVCYAANQTNIPRAEAPGIAFGRRVRPITQRAESDSAGSVLGNTRKKTGRAKGKRTNGRRREDMEGTSPSAEKKPSGPSVPACRKNGKGSDLEAARLLVEWQTRLYTKNALGFPEQIVWTNMVMPTELFYACGLAPVHAEMTAGWISSLLLSKEYIRVAEERGFHVGLCSYHKAVIGAMECGGDPPPPFWGGFPPYLRPAGTGCFSTSVSGSARRYSSSISPISSRERAVRFVEGQLRDLIRFLKAYTGKRSTPKRCPTLSVTQSQPLLATGSKRTEERSGPFLRQSGAPQPVRPVFFYPGLLGVKWRRRPITVKSRNGARGRRPGCPRISRPAAFYGSILLLCTQGT